MHHTLIPNLLFITQVTDESSYLVKVSTFKTQITPN